MKNVSINLMIMVFVAVILGAIGVGIVADQVNLKTDQIAASTETISIAPARLASNNINASYQFTLTNAPTGWKAQQRDCYVESFVLKNASGTAYTVTTDYVITAATGKLTLVNTTGIVAQTSNTTTANYNYCSNDYIASSFGRGSLNMVSGFFALLILIIVVAAVYFVIKQSRED